MGIREDGEEIQTSGVRIEVPVDRRTFVFEAPSAAPNATLSELSNGTSTKWRADGGVAQPRRTEAIADFAHDRLGPDF